MMKTARSLFFGIMLSAFLLVVTHGAATPWISDPSSGDTRPSDYRITSEAVPSDAGTSMAHYAVQTGNLSSIPSASDQQHTTPPISTGQNDKVSEEPISVVVQTVKDASSPKIPIVIAQDDAKNARNRRIDIFLHAIWNILESSKRADERIGASEALGYLGYRTSVPYLINALKDEDQSVRYFAAESLGKIKDPAAVAPLIEIIQDRTNKTSIRNSAAEALAQIKDQAVLPVGMKALSDKESDVRYTGLLALEGLAGPSEIPALINALHDQNYDNMKLAAYELANIGGPSVIAALTTAYEQQPSDRQAIIGALGITHDPLALPLLSSILKGSNNPFWQETIQAIGKIQDPAAFLLLIQMIGNKNIDPVIGSSIGQMHIPSPVKIEDPKILIHLLELLKSENKSTRDLAFAALYQIRDPRSIPNLLRQYFSKHNFGDEDSIQSLASAFGKPIVPFLNKVVRNDGDSRDYQRSLGYQESIVFLGVIKDPSSIPILVKAQAKYDDSDVIDYFGSFGVRGRKAREALIKIGKPALPALLRAIHDKNPYIRGNSLYAISKIMSPRDPRVLRLLFGGLKEEDNEVSDKCAQALGELGDPKAVPVLIGKALHEASDWVVAALGDLKDQRAINVLAKLQEIDIDNAHIVFALGKIGGPRIVPPLLKALENDNPFLISPALIELRKLKDPEIGPAILKRYKRSDMSFVECFPYFANAFGRFKVRKAVPELIYVMTEMTIKVNGVLYSAPRIAAAENLRRIGDVRAIPAFKSLINDKDICTIAAEALWIDFHQPVIVKNALEALDDSTRVKILLALSDTKDKYVADQLYKEFEQNKYGSGGSIVRALINMDDQRALPLLMRFISTGYDYHYINILDSMRNNGTKLN